MDKIIPNGVMVQITDKSNKRFGEFGIIYEYTSPYYRVHSFNKPKEDRWSECYSVDQFETVARKLWMVIFLIDSSDNMFYTDRYYIDKSLLSNKFFGDTLYQYSFRYNHAVFLRLKDYTDEEHSEFKKYFLNPILDKDGNIKEELLNVEKEVSIPGKNITVYYKIIDKKHE